MGTGKKKERSEAVNAASAVSATDEGVANEPISVTSGGGGGNGAEGRVDIHELALALAGIAEKLPEGLRISIEEEKQKGEDEGRTKLLPKEVRDSRPEKMRVFEEDECKEIEQHVARKVRPYDEKAKEWSMKYIREKQKEITVRFKKTDFESRIAPAIEASGLPTATFIKQAVEEKIARMEKENEGQQE